MGLHSGNVIARVAGGLRVVGPFYRMWTDGKGEGYSPHEKCKQTRERVRNENFKLKKVASRYNFGFFFFFS